MDQSQSLCKISGNQKVEKLKERIWRIHLNVGSLERTLRTLKRVWDEFQKTENRRDEMLLESLTFYAVVEYTKCFNSELSDKLDPSIFSDHLPSTAGSTDLSEREFHSLVMNYRNMHLVHSDKLLKVADTGGMKLPNSEFAVGPVTATRSYREDLAFYGAMNSLAKKALEETSRRLSTAQQRLMEAIKAGEAIITDETIKLMPVSDTLTPREMWGLPSRSS
ncbi:MAG: hypothetical protein NDI61_13845 [Bdellovibrionaceae bacterium]|nr:hypothetical protein [Pseudobdellovibrionaceae bacterium]